MTRNEVLDKLLSKYGKYGYTRLKISGLIKDGRNASRRKAYQIRAFTGVIDGRNKTILLDKIKGRLLSG